MSGWLPRILCAVRGHAYYRIAKVSPSSDHIGCRRCNAQWGMNHDARALLPWSEVAYLYEPWPYERPSREAIE